MKPCDEKKSICASVPPPASENTENKKTDCTKSEHKPDTTAKLSEKSTEIDSKLSVDKANAEATCDLTIGDTCVNRLTSEKELQDNHNVAAHQAQNQCSNLTDKTDNKCVSSSNVVDSEAGDWDQTKRSVNSNSDRDSNLRDTDKTRLQCIKVNSEKKEGQNTQDSANKETDLPKGDPDSQAVNMSLREGNEKTDRFYESDSIEQGGKYGNAVICNEKLLTETETPEDKGISLKSRDEADTHLTTSAENKVEEIVQVSGNKVKEADHNDNNQKKVVAIKEREIHVHFLEESFKKEEPGHPKDLLEVQAKMKGGQYISVVNTLEFGDFKVFGMGTQKKNVPRKDRFYSKTEPELLVLIIGTEK